MYQLKLKIIEMIKNDALLFAHIAIALDVRPATLSYLLKENSVKLTQKSILKILSQQLKVDEDDLVEIVEPANV